MQKGKKDRKLVVCAVILLFFGVACSPSIYADKSIEQQSNNTVYSQDEKLISLPVREYKPDGTIRKYFVELTESQYDEMNRRLQTAGDLDERLSIYKDYKVVPEDVTSESLRRGMEEKAQRFGLDKKIDKMMCDRYKPPSLFESVGHWYNFNCSVDFGLLWSIFKAIGLSALTLRLNLIIFLTSYGNFYEMIPSVDLLIFNAGLCGNVKVTDGDRPNIVLGFDYFPTFCGCILTVGFVGYSLGGVLALPYRCFHSLGYAYFISVWGMD